MRNKLMLAAIAVVTLVAALAFAMPQEGPEPGGPGGPGGRHGRMDFVAAFGDKLNLTDAQKAQIGGIQKASRDANAKFFETSRATMDEFRAARDANDTAKLDALKPTLDAQRAQMKQIRDAEMAKISTVLTADQRTQLDALRKERESHMREHRPHDE
ncbi:MAG: Spy/CpxP family protein refolding chaperone [Acidobacteria bacterium]|nr:Spy/CpxP family protein refolding chaperone [Acidobacteriota bacterium]MBV9474567.1 Spy/CpxP family protein refolding chaperone [Acidobacteriota bacterium]